MARTPDELRLEDAERARTSAGVVTRESLSGPGDHQYKGPGRADESNPDYLKFRSEAAEREAKGESQVGEGEADVERSRQEQRDAELGARSAADVSGSSGPGVTLGTALEKNANNASGGSDVGAASAASVKDVTASSATTGGAAATGTSGSLPAGPDGSASGDPTATTASTMRSSRTL